MGGNEAAHFKGNGNFQGNRYLSAAESFAFGIDKLTPKSSKKQHKIASLQPPTCSSQVPLRQDHVPNHGNPGRGMWS